MKGFTFIELLVTLGVAMLIFTGIVAGYNKFTDTTRIQQVALSFKNDLRLAQNKAVTGEKPLGLPCDELLGYQLSFTASSYSVKVQCNPPQNNAPEKKVDLPKPVTFSPVPSSLLFKVLANGVNINAVTTFTFVSASLKYEMQINPQGIISDIGFQ